MLYLESVHTGFVVVADSHCPDGDVCSTAAMRVEGGVPNQVYPPTQVYHDLKSLTRPQEMDHLG